MLTLVMFYGIYELGHWIYNQKVRGTIPTGGPCQMPPELRNWHNRVVVL